MPTFCPQSLRDSRLASSAHRASHGFELVVGRHCPVNPRCDPGRTSGPVRGVAHRGDRCSRGRQCCSCTRDGHPCRRRGGSTSSGRALPPQCVPQTAYIRWWPRSLCWLQPGSIDRRRGFGKAWTMASRLRGGSGSSVRARDVDSCVGGIGIHVYRLLLVNRRHKQRDVAKQHGSCRFRGRDWCGLELGQLHRCE